MKPNEHPAWPQLPHPATGEPFVSGRIDRRVEYRDVRYLPPWPPERTVVEYDDWGNVISSRELTDEEYERALRNYRKADAEYERTMGRLRVKGQEIIEGAFETKSGSTAKGYAYKRGDQWEWEWTEVVRG